MFFGTSGLFRRTAPRLGLFAPTRPLFFAHWYAGLKRRHRYAREKRYHPVQQVRTRARNRFSHKLHHRTNRWNYQQAYKDM